MKYIFTPAKHEVVLSMDERPDLFRRNASIAETQLASALREWLGKPDSGCVGVSCRIDLRIAAVFFVDEYYARRFVKAFDWITA